VDTHIGYEFPVELAFRAAEYFYDVRRRRAAERR
jgi:hypothetical protein